MKIFLLLSIKSLYANHLLSHYLLSQFVGTYSGSRSCFKYNKLELHIVLQAFKGCRMNFSEVLKISSAPDCANFTNILNILKPTNLEHMQIESGRGPPSPNYVCLSEDYNGKLFVYKLRL